MLPSKMLKFFHLRFGIFLHFDGNIYMDAIAHYENVAVVSKITTDLDNSNPVFDGDAFNMVAGLIKKNL